MRFILNYRGVLVAQSSGTGGRVAEKQAIRRYLHPQLEKLWQTDVNRLADIRPEELLEPVRKGDVFDVGRPIRGFKYFFFRYRLVGFDFIPLVTEPQEARCRLDVRLHRPIAPGSIIFAGGDLDNRLKVLFDALRMPKEPQEVEERAQHEGQRIFCLLADDRLITDLSIESFRLLGPQPVDENYVEVEIVVTVQAVTPMMGTLSFLFP